MEGRVRHRGRSAVIALMAALVVPPAASAQSGEGPSVSLTGRVHAQWNTSGADDAIDSEFLIRRARVTAVVEVNELVSGKVQPEFAGGAVTLKDAYVRLGFSPAFTVSMGQFKRPFDFFDLESSTRNLVIERTGRIRGLGSCAGVGGICSYSRFTEKLDYADRDIGVKVEGALDGSPLTYALAVTNGEGANVPDTNSRKSFTGRLEYAVRENLRVGANVGSHDYVSDVDGSDEYGTAFGADLDWGGYDPGLHLQWAWAIGDNWRNPNDMGAASTFNTTQAVVSYRFAVEDRPNLNGVEPVFRLSWADPDTDLDDDDEIFATTGVILHFIGRNRLAANVEMWEPAFGDREWALKVQTYLHF